jgi:tetratricopeptide (TPR) repeat protein
MSLRRRTAWAAVIATTQAWTFAVRAESESTDAEILFREGREAFKKGDYAAACPKFEESQRLDPAIGTLLNLALCEERWGRLADARRHLGEVLASSDLDEQRRVIATEHAEALDRRAPEEQTAPVPEPKPAKAAPAAAAPALAAPARPSPVRRDTPPNGSTSPHAAVYILGGLGLLSLTTCAVTGILVIDRADTVDAHCPNKSCDDEGLAAASSGRTLSAVATATFGVGVALTALSVYFLTQSSRSAPHSGVTVSGRAGGADLSWAGEF